MSQQSCGYAPVAWLYEDDKFFLRDDQESGITDYPRWSLFREEPYGRIAVYSGATFAQVIKWCTECIEEERQYEL